MNTNANNLNSSISADDLLNDIIKAIEDTKRNEPFRKWMVEQGFDPDTGGVLVIPEVMWNMFGGSSYVPKYIVVSKLAVTPLLMRRAIIEDPLTFKYIA